MISHRSGVLSFTSEAIENIPSGWRARESYIVHGRDECEEILEPAAHCSAKIRDQLRHLPLCFGRVLPPK